MVDCAELMDRQMQEMGDVDYGAYGDDHPLPTEVVLLDQHSSLRRWTTASMMVRYSTAQYSTVH